jgi:hypothetical protein
MISPSFRKLSLSRYRRVGHRKLLVYLSLNAPNATNFRARSGSGGIVAEAALHDALVSGKLHNAGLDVFAMEPTDGTAPLLRLDQVAVTPHTAGSVIDLVTDIARHASPTCSPCCAALRCRRMT